MTRESGIIRNNVGDGIEIVYSTEPPYFWHVQDRVTGYESSGKVGTVSRSGVMAVAAHELAIEAINGAYAVRRSVAVPRIASIRQLFDWACIHNSKVIITLAANVKRVEVTVKDHVYLWRNNGLVSDVTGDFYLVEDNDATDLDDESYNDNQRDDYTGDE